MIFSLTFAAIAEHSACTWPHHYSQLNSYVFLASCLQPEEISRHLGLLSAIFFVFENGADYIFGRVFRK